MIGTRKLEQRLLALETRLARIESTLTSMAREAALRRELEATRHELDQLSQQSLHVVDLLGESRRRIEELEQERRA